MANTLKPVKGCEECGKLICPECAEDAIDEQEQERADEVAAEVYNEWYRDEAPTLDEHLENVFDFS